MFGMGLALVGLQAAQAQVTIDITKLTCFDFLADRRDQLKNPRHLAERLREWRAWQDDDRASFRRTHRLGNVLPEPQGRAGFGRCPKRFWRRQIVIWRSCARRSTREFVAISFGRASCPLPAVP